MFQVYNQDGQVLYQHEELKNCIDHTEKLYEACGLNPTLTGIAIGNPNVACVLRHYQLLYLLSVHPDFFVEREYYAEANTPVFKVTDEEYEYVRNYIRFYIK